MPETFASGSGDATLAATAAWNKKWCDLLRSRESIVVWPRSDWRSQCGHATKEAGINEVSAALAGRTSRASLAADTMTRLQDQG